MWLLTWLVRVALFPLKWVEELVKDITFNNSEEEGLASALTLWVSSLVKWTAKWIQEGIEDIEEN